MPRAFLILIVTALSAVPALAQSEFTVAVQEIADRKAVFGTVQSVDLFAARARIGGTVRGLSVDEGSAVQAGHIIATVEDPKLDLQAVAIDARIRSIEAQKKLARSEYERLSKLRKSGTISQARLDEAQANVNVITGNHAAMVAERAVLEQRLAEGAILAPGDGRVLRIEATEGSVILPGEAVAIIAAERYVLRIELPERHAGFIRSGDEVLVGARGLAANPEDDLRKGHIVLVYPEMRNGRVVADAEVDGLGDYFVGERTRVYVATGHRQAIVIPVEFLNRRYGVTYAVVKEEGEVMVQPGRLTGGGVEILAGLKPGDILLQP